MGVSSSKAHDRSLTDWYSKIKNGNIMLPRFQRMGAWDRQRIVSFLETVIHNLPVGVTLILNVGDQEQFISRYIETAEPTSPVKVNEHLLDGQQRLTSLWRGLQNSYENETYFVYFSEFDSCNYRTSESSTSIYCKTRYQKRGQLYPLWADSPRECFSRGSIPIELFRPEDIQSEIDRWIENAIPEIELDPKDNKSFEKLKALYSQKQILKDRIIRMRETITHFNLPYLSLPSTTPKEIALQVFINMNTNSKPLTIYDIIVAEIEDETGCSLHDLKTHLDDKHPKLKNYFDLEFLILATSALLQEKLPSHRGMAELDKPLLIENWSVLENCLGRMAIFMESQGIFDKARLPTNAVLSVVAAAMSNIPEDGDVAGQGEILLKKYLWSSFFTNRYENSAASRAFQDYMGLKSLFLFKMGEKGGQFLENEIPVLNRDLNPITDKDELLKTFWPKKVNIRARGILAISTKLGALDFADGKQISIENIGKREYHHIFPDALLKEASKYSSLALNCALITGTTNRNIGRKDPLSYLMERYAWVEENVVHTRLNSHLIPIHELSNGGYENLEAEERIEKIKKDFETFINARADYFIKAINLLVEGEEITVESIIGKTGNIPEPIKNLFKEIESIEILLRQLIDIKLNNLTEDPYTKFVSERTRQSTEFKIASYLKKFPGENINKYTAFRAKLNFFTLGEFKELIVQRTCWTEFENIFKSKQNLDSRFNQLFTLRNQIAHNNELNDIMIKDGEAAVLWFKDVLEE